MSRTIHDQASSFTVLLSLLAITAGFWPLRAIANYDPTSLAAEVEQFNGGHGHTLRKLSQPPLTENEVIAAIRWSHADPTAISPDLLHHCKRIAMTGQFPSSAKLEILTNFDPGGDFVFKICSIRIRITREDGTSDALIVRNSFVASWTLEEELDRLRAKGVDDDALGQFSDAKRIKNLTRRIEFRRRSQD